MRPTDLCQLWGEFQSRSVNMNIHQDDVMYKMAQEPWHYEYVGMSGAEVVFTALSAAPTLRVESILDFGCGHGRVARYLRALFPGARMTFAEVDKSCVEFCAVQFSGTAIVTPKDFNHLELPGKYDLIWLGSVFTHMDYARMKVLFAKLFAVLNPNGILVGTFRGDKMYQSYASQPDVATRDTDLLAEYEATGVAYRRYPGWTDDWGLSLVKPQKLIELGQEHPEARLIMYTEVGWASAHDAVAWTNVSPQTVIR